MGKKRSKNFHIHFYFNFHSNVWLLRKVKCVLYQNNYKKKHKRCGKGTCKKQPGMPRKSGSLLIVIVNKINFIPHEQSFWTKEFSQGFSDFLYALSFKNENPTKLVMSMERHLWQKDYMQIWRRTQIFALENKYLYQDKNIWDQHMYVIYTMHNVNIR